MSTITNETEYNATAGTVTHLRQEMIAHLLKDRPANVHPIIWDSMYAAMLSVRDELLEDMQDYKSRLKH